MAIVTCTFEGVVGAQIIKTIPNGNNVYVIYDDGTSTLKAKRISLGAPSTAKTIATSVTDVS